MSKTIALFYKKERKKYPNQKYIIKKANQNAEDFIKENEDMLWDMRLLKL